MIAAMRATTTQGSSPNVSSSRSLIQCNSSGVCGARPDGPGPLGLTGWVGALVTRASAAAGPRYSPEHSHALSIYHREHRNRRDCFYSVPSVVYTDAKSGRQIGTPSLTFRGETMGFKLVICPPNYQGALAGPAQGGNSRHRSATVPYSGRGYGGHWRRRRRIRRYRTGTVRTRPQPEMGRPALRPGRKPGIIMKL